MLGHSRHSPGFPWDNWRFNALAVAGVRVFFVISGFLITSLLLSEERREGRISLKYFYIRRAWRIFPPFYAYLLFIALGTAFGYLAASARDIFFASVYLANSRPERFWMLGHLWSLAVEEQFYLVWPAIVAFASAVTRRWILVAMLFVAPAVRFVALHAGGGPFGFTDQSTLAVADVLAVGCLLAIYRDRLHALAFYRRMLNGKMLVGAVLLAALIIEFTTSRGFFLLQSILNFDIAFLIDASVFLAPAVLNHRLLNRIGVLSYSLYLWQQVFCLGVRHWWHSFPVNIGLSFVCAWLSFRFIEAPALAYGRRKFAKPPAVVVIPDHPPGELSGAA